MHDKSKFKLSETFNNSNGKTSGSGFIGVLVGLVTVIGFIAGTIAWFLGKPDTMVYFEKVLQLGGLSAILMGVRKVSGAFMAPKSNYREDKENKDKELETI